MRPSFRVAAVLLLAAAAPSALAHADEDPTEFAFPTFSQACTEAAVAPCADSGSVARAGDYDDDDGLTCLELISWTNCVDQEFPAQCTGDEDVSEMAGFKADLQFECDNVEVTLNNPVTTPTAAAEEPDESDDPACFPGSATVTLQGGRAIPMAKLRVGHRVLSSSGVFSEIFFFTHKDHSAKTTFVQLTAAGKTLALSPNHYIPVAGQLKPARKVAIGDQLEQADGTLASVSRVETVHATGLFNPHTETGEVVVDGIRASCYTTAIPPEIGHALLRPVYALHKFGLEMPLHWLALGAPQPIKALLQ